MNKSLRFILSASLIILTGKGTSVLANPINSTQADLLNLPQTSELLVKDLKNLPVETIPQTPLEETTLKTTDAEKSLCEQLSSSQQILETPEIEIPVISTQSLLKCTESKPGQPLELAQDVPAETEIEQTAPEDVEPANPPTNEQSSQTKNDLAAQSQNPIADLISLPFQNNLNFGSGPRERLQYILNVQPVIPIKLSEDWLLVSRTVVPFINQPKPINDTTFGIGDINPQFFFVPTTDNSELTIGFGPTIILPTASATVTGSGKWGFGPTGVVVWTRGKIVAGALASHTWSIAGDPNRRRIDFTFIQPFFNYNLPKGWFLVTAPFITADWANRDGDQWTVPIGGGVGRIFTVAKQPVSLSAQAYYNLVRPDEGSDWSLRLALTLLFPKN